nr:MAG: internal scaffolding protein [Microvirus sp.]
MEKSLIPGLIKMTKSKKRKYSQDFSEASCGRITDSSFAPGCDVNRIVKHHAQTGIDPFESRKSQAVFQDAPTQGFDEAMRISAELDSAFANQPLAVREAHQNNPATWWTSEIAKTLASSQETSPAPPAEPPPEDPDSDNSESEVQ